MNPYLIIGALVAAIALAGGGYWKGWADRAARVEAAAGKAAVQSYQAQIEKAGTQAIIATKLEQDNARERIVYRTITNQIDRYVASPVFVDAECLDADGLRLARAAIAGTAPAAGEPADAVPGATGAR